MKTRLSTVSELKQIFVESLLNNTNKISKVSDNSVNNGIAFGVAKVAQKAIKDIALVEAHIMVDSAYGNQLDDIAQSRGIAGRFASSDSSTYIRVVGDVGTVYTAGVQVFSGADGEAFDTETTTTIGDDGYAYVKVRSQGTGISTNVAPLSLSAVAPAPTGHLFCVNEYTAYGGRDVEDDELFRKRIKEGINLAATDTLSKLTQIMNKINSAVIRVVYQGTNEQSQVVLAVVTHNGVDLTVGELNDIENKVEEYLAISDLKPFGSASSRLELKNIEYQPIDVTFRVELLPSYDVDLVRKDIQVQFSKYLDFRFWDPSRKVEWDDLLGIVKNSEGVRSVPDTKFIPGVDITVDKNKIPRFRSFLMLDLEGNIISDNSGNLNPVYYPANPDDSFQQTILASI
jgi:hypothetical protein